MGSQVKISEEEVRPAGRRKETHYSIRVFFPTFFTFHFRRRKFYFSWFKIKVGTLPDKL